MRSSEIMVVTCILLSEMSQDEDDINPPDVPFLLFDLDPNEALDRCMPGSNEPKCICSRVMRS
jgi:hypothetical protein